MTGIEFTLYLVNKIGTEYTVMTRVNNKGHRLEVTQDLRNNIYSFKESFVDISDPSSFTYRGDFTGDIEFNSFLSNCLLNIQRMGVKA